MSVKRMIGVIQIDQMRGWWQSRWLFNVADNSDVFDAHADRVSVRLKGLGIVYFRLNLDINSLINTQMTFDDSVWNIETANGSTVSSDISCVWIRKYFVELSIQEWEQLNIIDFKIWRNEFNATLLGLYTSLKLLPWLNPISNTIKCDNKYYQMDLANNLAFKMPKTVVSNDRARLIRFAKSCNGDVIFKLLNNRYIMCITMVLCRVYILIG